MESAHIHNPWSISRRDFVAANLAALAAGLPAPTQARAAWSTAQTFVLVDERLDAAQSIMRAAAGAGLQVGVTGGDVTALWQSRLRQLWQSPGATLLGYSMTDVVFCLDLLGRDQGFVLTEAGPWANSLFNPRQAQSPNRRLELTVLPCRENQEPLSWKMVHRSKLA